MRWWWRLVRSVVSRACELSTVSLSSTTALTLCALPWIGRLVNRSVDQVVRALVRRASVCRSSRVESLERDARWRVLLSVVWCLVLVDADDVRAVKRREEEDEKRERERKERERALECACVCACGPRGTRSMSLRQSVPSSTPLPALAQPRGCPLHDPFFSRPRLARAGSRGHSRSWGLLRLQARRLFLQSRAVDAIRAPQRSLPTHLLARVHCIGPIERETEPFCAQVKPAQ